MKINLLLLISLLSAGAARAQTAPVITAADMPAVNDSLRLSLTTALPANAPPLTRNGPNQTWNYAGLTATAQRVERFAGPGSVAGPLIQATFNSFLSPNNRATLASPQSLPLPAGTPLPISNPQQFFNTSSADFRSVGYSVEFNGLGVPVTYTTRAQQDIIYRFPLNYGGTIANSSSLLESPAVVASSGSFSQARVRATQADAWGTLTTPFGTFTTLRVVATLTDNDVVTIAGSPSQSFTLVTRQYQWLASGVHVPLLTITTSLVAGQEVVTGVEYRDSFRRFVPLAARSAALDAAFSAAPNPSAAGTALRLAVPVGSGPLTVRGTDAVGRQLFSRTFAGSTSGQLVLDAATLCDFKGLLLLTVTSAQGTATRRVVRE